MQNVKMTRSGNILTVTIDLSAETSPSASGKTLVIASTKGNQKIPDGDEIIGINCYRYPSKK